MTRKLLSTLSVLAAAVVLIPSVAFAQSANASTKAQEALDAAKEKASQAVENASDKATAIQNKAESTALKVRQEVCEQKRTRLQTISQTMSQGATSVKNNLDTMYQRVVTFYESGQLTVTDFQSYIDKIEAAKQEATTSMEALQQRENSDIDCADAKTAVRLEGDKLAGEGVKTALKQYRSQLVDLISAMKATAATEGTTNE